MWMKRHGKDRYGTPTLPEAAREMKTTSNRANDLCQKPRTWRGRRAGVKRRRSGLPRLLQHEKDGEPRKSFFLPEASTLFGDGDAYGWSTATK